MKKFGLLVFALLAATAASIPKTVVADPPIWYCELNGAGYQYFDRDGYAVCIENCTGMINGVPIQGECWLSPPPPLPPPGTPGNPPGPPDTTT